MLKRLTRPALPLTALLMLVAVGTSMTSGCGGDGAKDFGGGDSGGRTGASGGDTGASGGHLGATGGATGTGTGGANVTGGATGTASGGTTSTGGGTATGGAVGTGGRAATGGTTATGGATGTGGRIGTGGTGAMPGTGGTGATTGTGGRGGTGATIGTGGRPGSGGTTGTGGAAAMCDAIADDYQAALPSAKACNTITHITVPQCQLMASASLGCGSTCIIYVQDDDKLTEIHKRWNTLDCQAMIRACPAIACLNAKPGNCYASVGSATASCQNLPK